MSRQRWCDLVVRETGAGQGRAGQAALTIGVIRVYVYSSLYSIWETGGYFMSVPMRTKIHVPY